MKRKYFNVALIFALIFTLGVDLMSAQDFKDLDSSPHDIVYFRTNKISPPNIKVLYGRPKKNGREIFGEVIPYDKIWRVGANEATEVVFYQDVVFGEKEVKAGTYVLYAIPHQKEWTLILSSNTDVWGTQEYEKKYDVARATAKVSKAEFLEAFSIGFKDKGNHVNMVLAWDTTRITTPIKIVL
jgi:hypothetical protein